MSSLVSNSRYSCRSFKEKFISRLIHRRERAGLAAYSSAFCIAAARRSSKGTTRSTRPSFRAPSAVMSFSDSKSSYALLAPTQYLAKAIIAPPDESSSPGLSAALGAFGGFGAQLAGRVGLPIASTEANRLTALLESHRLLSQMVEKHGNLSLSLLMKFI